MENGHASTVGSPDVTAGDPIPVAQAKKEAEPDTLAKLTAYSQEMVKRYQEVLDLFEDKLVKPNEELKNIVSSKLTTVCLSYIIDKHFQPDVLNAEADSKEELLKKLGYAVSDIPASALKHKKTGETLAPALLESPAAQLALANGADLLGNTEE